MKIGIFLWIAKNLKNNILFMKMKNRLQQVLNVIALPFSFLKNIVLRANALSTLVSGQFKKTDVVAKKKYVDWWLRLRNRIYKNYYVMDNRPFKEYFVGLLRKWIITIVSILDPDKLFPLIFWGICSIGCFYFSLTFKVEKYEWLNYVGTLLGAISVNLFTNNVDNIKGNKKLKEFGLSTIRKFDTILECVVHIRKTKKFDNVAMLLLEKQIISNICELEDVVPDLKYRDKLNQIKTLTDEIEILEKNKKLDNDEQIKLSKRKNELNTVIGEIRLDGYEGLILSGSTSN